jgi:hypothetical protein
VTAQPPPFVGWPGRAHLADATRCVALVTLLFATVYGAGDFVTAQRAQRLHLFSHAELAIPFWTPAILVYDSVYLWFLLVPFVLRTRASLRHLARAIALATGVAGVAFVALPAEIGFPPPVVRGPLAGIFALTDAVNLDYNLVPSLHVCFTILCAQAFWPTAPRRVRVILIGGAAALALSTLLAHQHHVLDVVTGAGLAPAAFSLARPRPARSDRRSTPSIRKEGSAPAA